jgi:hypothetical protein
MSSLNILFFGLINFWLKLFFFFLIFSSVINKLFIYFFINLILNYFNFEKNNKNIYNILTNFKNVDLFFINITRKTLKQIGDYLNSKYYKRNLNNPEIKLFDTKIKEKKEIKFYSVGSSSDYFKNLLIKDITKLYYKITCTNRIFILFA